MSETRVVIYSLDEGFVIHDDIHARKYAVGSSQQLIDKIKDIFEISEQISLDKSENNIFAITEAAKPTKEAKHTSHSKDKLTWKVYDTGVIYIERLGYNTTVSILMTDIKYFNDHPGDVKNTLRKFGKDTSANKAAIIRTFMREVPFDSINDYLINQEQGQEDGSCDDVTFESCANNKPENCKSCVNQSMYEAKGGT